MYLSLATNTVDAAAHMIHVQYALCPCVWITGSCPIGVLVRAFSVEWLFNEATDFSPADIYIYVYVYTYMMNKGTSLGVTGPLTHDPVSFESLRSPEPEALRVSELNC